MAATLAAKRAPRRLLRWVVSVLALLALVGGAELALRAIIPSVIANTVRENLRLSSDHPVHVQLGGSALLPALTGHVNDVSVRVSNVIVFDNIETDLFASADSLPFDPTRGEIVGATASARIPSAHMGAVMSLVSNGLITDGEVRDGELELGRTLQMFGFDVRVAASLAVSVEGGDLVVSPTEVHAAGFDLTSDQLRPLLGDAAATLLDTHTVCVRDRLPRGVTLTGVELDSSALGGSATLRATLDPDVLSNPKQQQLGSCDSPE